jgi:branched-chain amino acid transport system substrate-binding protein
LSQPSGDPEDLFKVDAVVAGDKTSPAVADTGCKMRMAG